MVESKTLYRYILYLNILLDSLGWSMIIPALPQIHDSLALSTIMIGTISSSISFFTFISSTVQGKLTEFFGNRGVLLLSPVSQFVANLLLIIALTQKHILLYTFSRCLPAFFKCGMIASQAMIYDISGPDNIQDFGLLYAFSNLAFIIGPILGGYLYTVNPLSPFVSAIVTSGCSIVLLHFLPTSATSTATSTTSADRERSHSDILMSYDSNSALSPTTTASSTTSLKSSALTSNSSTPSTFYNRNSHTFHILSNPFLLHYLHIKFSFQVGLSLFEAFFSLHSRNSMGLTSPQIGTLLSIHGILSLVTNLYLINVLMKFTTTSQLDVWLLPLVSLLGVGMLIWCKTTSFPLYIFGVLLLGVTGNLFQCVIQNRIGMTQDEEKKKEKEMLLKEIKDHERMNQLKNKKDDKESAFDGPDQDLEMIMKNVEKTPPSSPSSVKIRGDPYASPDKTIGLLDINTSSRCSTPRNIKLIRQIFDPTIDSTYVDVTSPSNTRPQTPTNATESQLENGVSQKSSEEHNHNFNTIYRENSDKSINNNGISSQRKSTKKMKHISAIFGLSAAADRAARIISPFVGSLFMELFGTNGLVIFSAFITGYCAMIIVLGPTMKIYGFATWIGLDAVKSKQKMKED